MRPEASEIDRLIADATSLRRDTGWAPRVDLTEGLAKTADWIRRHPEFFEPRKYRL
jgi:nucleoside-diphosphate-sugar epimerase